MFLIPYLLKWGVSSKFAKPLAYTLMLLVSALVVWGVVAGLIHHGRVLEREVWQKKIAEYEQKLEANQKVYDLLVTKLKADNLELVMSLELKLKASEARKDQVRIIVKEVVKYVTPKADSQCVLTQGVEYVIDAALQPEAPVPVDVDASTGLTLSQLSAITASNMSECVVRGDVIQAWQEWYAKTKKTWDDVRAATPKDPEIPH